MPAFADNEEGLDTSWPSDATFTEYQNALSYMSTTLHRDLAMSDQQLVESLQGHDEPRDWGFRGRSAADCA